MPRHSRTIYNLARDPLSKRTPFSDRISVVPCLVIPPVFVKIIAMTEETTIQEQDALTDALNDLFTNVSAMIKGDLQGTNNVMKLLENMNLKVAEEYKGFGDVASGLRVFVERLKAKSENFDEYVLQIDAIEQQVSDLEVVISMLDKYVSLLESKVQSFYHVPTSSA